MSRIQAGQTSLFELLIHRYQSALLRVARSRLRRPDWAEDVVQETFLAAYKSRHTYRPDFSFRTWLWTILLNQCRSQEQRQARWPQASYETGPEESCPAQAVSDSCPSPLASLLFHERSGLLEDLLSQITATQADALRLRFFAGLKFQEIADTMGCSLGTAKNRVQWGLMKISQLMENQTSYKSLADDWRQTE